METYVVMNKPEAARRALVISGLIALPAFVRHELDLEFDMLLLRILSWLVTILFFMVFPIIIGAFVSMWIGKRPLMSADASGIIAHDYFEKTKTYSWHHIEKIEPSGVPFYRWVDLVMREEDGYAIAQEVKKKKSSFPEKQTLDLLYFTKDECAQIAQHLEQMRQFYDQSVGYSHSSVID